MSAPEQGGLSRGICGDRCPPLVMPNGEQRAALCMLLAGHTGWHHGDDGSDWSAAVPAADAGLRAAVEGLADLSAAATPGPWEHVRIPFRETASHSVKRGDHVLALVGWEREEPERCPADAALIVAAVNLVRSLLAGRGGV